MSECINQLVSEAMTNALVNGCDYVGWSDLDIASEMLAYDSEIEDYDHKTVIQAVSRYRMIKRMTDERIKTSPK